jgi:S1-C subfamily serine protease
MRTLRPLPAALAALAICGTGCGGGSTTTTSVPLPRSADTLERRQIDVVRRVSPSVVQIETSSGLGSGVVYDGKGHIVTNAHVVGGSRRFTVTLSEGDHHSATLVGAYAPQDLAVIRLDSGSPPAASLADSGKVEVGQFALAIGNPLGLRSSVTQGIISSLGRTVSEGNGVVISSAMQTSAPINPGNSGGALLNTLGQVVGVNDSIESPIAGNVGVGFAIPINAVKQLLSSLEGGANQ